MMQAHTSLVYLTADPNHLLTYLNEKSASAQIRIKNIHVSFDGIILTWKLRLYSTWPIKNRVFFLSLVLILSTLLPVLLGVLLGTNI